MVRRLFTIAFGVMLFAGFVASAEAMVFAPSATYTSERVVDNTGRFSNMDSRAIWLDLRLGTVFAEKGLYLGGLLKIESESYLNGGLRGYALGPSIGWVEGAFSVIATYHLAAQRVYSTSSVATTLSAGRGLQLDVAWTPLIAANLGLGPQLTFLSMRFDRSKIGDAAETGNGYEDTVVTPALVLWYAF